MKTVALHFQGKKYSLVYNVAALFEIEATVDKDWIDKIQERSADGLTVLSKVAAIMSDYGAAARVYLGFDKGDNLSAEDIKNRANVKEYMDIQNAVITAINVGIEREITDDDEEIDLVLEEIQKKTDPKKSSKPK